MCFFYSHPPPSRKATEEQQNAMRGQAGAIAELARDLEGTTGILRRLKLLLEDRNQTLDGEMAEIQVKGHCNPP